MRTIRELLGEDEKIWFYIENEELWEKFLEMTENFHFGELTRDKWKFGHVIAVHSNGEMGHVPIFVWSMSFGDKEGAPAKYDLKKVISDEADVSCRTSHFRGRMIY